MALPISYTSGADTPTRLGQLILGALMAVPAAMPSLLHTYPWLLQLPLVNEAPGLARYVFIVGGGLIMLTGLVATQDIWTIDATGVTCASRGWLGTRKRHYDYSAIASVTVAEINPRRGSIYFLLTVKLKTGRKLRFRFGDSWDEAWEAKREIEDGMGVIPS